MCDKLAMIPDVTIRGVRPCDVCMFYNPDADHFRQSHEYGRVFEIDRAFCRWNLTWDEFCQVYDPYIM